MEKGADLDQLIQCRSYPISNYSKAPQNMQKYVNIIKNLDEEVASKIAPKWKDELLRELRDPGHTDLEGTF